MEKVAVYTALFGDYDTLHAPIIIDPDVDYIAFTDSAVAIAEPWQRRIVPLPHPDPRKASRYYFDQSTLVLPEYEYTIMHGANAQLASLTPSILSYLGNNDIAAFRHPHRQNVYDEPAVCAALGKDNDLARMLSQVDRYKKAGFDGVPFSACILLVRHNTNLLREFEEFWWSEVKRGSHRDQLSFDYCRWECGLEISFIPGDPFACDFFKVNSHR